MTPVIAAIVWTPMVYYIAMGIAQILLVYVGFRLLHVDPENNTFIGAVLAAAAINAVAFFVKDLGVIGIMVQIATIFGALTLVSSGEAIKSAVVGGLCVVSFAGAAHFLIPRTPLTLESIGGFAQVVLQGGLDAEPIDEEAAEALADGDVKGVAR